MGFGASDGTVVGAAEWEATMIGMRRATIWVLFASVLALCTPTAEAKGIYLGASLGRAEARDLDLATIDDGSVLTGGTDGTDNGWKLFAGFKVFKIVNAEFGYRDYGQVSFSATSDGTGTIYAAGPVDGLADTTAVSVSAMVVLPVGRFKFFAKGGIARWRTETTVRHSTGNIATSESDGVDALYGFGAAWALKNSAGLRVEYERLATNAADRDFLSVGVHFRF